MFLFLDELLFTSTGTSPFVAIDTRKTKNKASVTEGLTLESVQKTAKCRSSRSYVVHSNKLCYYTLSIRIKEQF